MFGLEGCGFVLSISVTFLLIGLVVYLFKKQLKTLEQKFVAIFQLSQTLATSVETLRHNYSGGDNKTTSSPNPPDTRPSVILSDSDTESDTESDYEADNMCCPFPNVKIVDLEHEPLKEHMLKVFNFNNKEMDKILDVTDLLADDKGGETMGVEAMGTETMGVKAVEAMGVEDDTDEDTDEDDTDGEEEDAEPDSPNYKGMKVPDLRKLVQDKKIATDQSLKSLKKQELITLLKKTN